VDARRVAYEILLRTEREGAYADVELGRALSGRALAEADRKLATLLVYGTLARRLTLDHTIARYADRKISKIDLPALTAIRLAVFQIGFLDRVPAYAAVDGSVKLAKKRSPRTAGFVNAVLRRVAERGLVDPDDADPLTRLSIRVSHPRWLAERWCNELGEEEAERLMHADNEPMPNAMRILTDRDSAERALAAAGIESRDGRYAPDAVITSRAESLPGVAIPQSEASQVVALFLDVHRGMRVLDACAAPGGKTAYLARLVGPGGHVTAVDSARGSARRIRATLESTGTESNVDIHEMPVEALDESGGYDAVLVDAPCSGLGTLREHPEIRWRREPDDIADLAARQRSALAAAAKHLRPGGRLVYSTCTLLAEENDEVVDGFLQDNSEFAAAPSPFGDVPAAELVGTDGRLRTYPHRHDTAGFFAAGIRKKR
jgi:16S rRNA (cytosine967-C5)-methyltransferase